MNILLITALVWAGSGAGVMASEITCKREERAEVTVTMARNSSGHWSMSVNLQQQVSVGKSPKLQMNAVPSVTLCGNTATHALLITMTGHDLIIPEGFKKVDGIGYYKLYIEPMKWAPAKKVCEDQKSHLLILNSQAEADAMAALMNQASRIGTYIFIGITDSGRGNWVTLHGEKLSDAGFADWSIGELDTDPGGEDCGGFGKNKKLHDLGCEEIHSFICEYPIL